MAATTDSADRDDALLAACARGALPTLRQALAAGADPNARDNRGRTPLHLVAAASVPERERQQAVEALLEAGAGPFMRDDAGARPQLPRRAQRKLDEARGAALDPAPLVLFRGDENPLLPWLLRLEPRAAPVAELTHHIGLLPPGDRRPHVTPVSLFPETRPETPGGMGVAVEQGEALASNEVLRRELSGADHVFGQGYLVRVGYHTDASLEACWRSLPRHQAVLRWGDLVRRFGSPPRRPDGTTLEAVRRIERERGGEARLLVRRLTAGEAIARVVEPWLQEAVAAALYGTDLLSWNNLDWQLAVALGRSGALALLDGAVDASDGSIDRHARLRERLEAAGVDEHAMLVGVLSSTRFCQVFTGREVWVATRDPGRLAAALVEAQVRQPRALVRTLRLLHRWLQHLEAAPARAQEVWRRAQPGASEASVLEVLRLERERFAPWVAEHATHYGDEVFRLLTAGDGAAGSG